MQYNPAKGQPAAVFIQELSFRFDDRRALDRVSLTVQPGQLFAILGPNGSGKTTLLRLLATLLSPQEGDLYVCGLSVRVQPALVRMKLGLVFQHPSLDLNLTVGENFRHQGHLYGLYGDVLRTRTRALLDQFSISDRANDLVKALSGGLRRRTEIAKSLLHQPEVLLLDEPTTGLDPAARMSFMQTLADLRDRRVTSILSTHLMEEAERCDRVAIMDHGHVVACDSPKALTAAIGADIVTINAPDVRQLADDLSARLPVPATVHRGAVRIESPAGHELIARIAREFPGQFDSIQVSRPTLSDVFLRLTGSALTENSEAQS